MKKLQILLTGAFLFSALLSAGNMPERYAASDKYRLVWNDDPSAAMTIAWDQNDSTSLPFTFIAGGDTKSEGNPLRVSQNSNRLVAKLRPLFVAFNGDFTSGNGTNEQNWKNWLLDWQEMTTTDDGRMIPLVPVHGNHENGDRANLNYIFNVPCQENDISKIYYSLSLGGDFFHMLKITYPLVPDSSSNSFLGYIRDDKYGTMFLGEGSWGASPRPNDHDKPWTLTSGSFNQVQWIHVIPKTKDEEAHMKIFTVLSAACDTKGNLTLYKQDIKALNEQNLFDIPVNIALHEPASAGKYVRYPFH